MISEPRVQLEDESTPINENQKASNNAEYKFVLRGSYSLMSARSFAKSRDTKTNLNESIHKSLIFKTNS